MIEEQEGIIGQRMRTERWKKDILRALMTVMCAVYMWPDDKEVREINIRRNHDLKSYCFQIKSSKKRVETQE